MLAPCMLNKEYIMRLLKAKEVAERTSISVAQIHRLIRKEKFPVPIKVSEARSAWLEAEINEWISLIIKQNR